MNRKSFSINIKGPVPNRVEVIKALRSLTGLGLKEAMAATDTYGVKTFNFGGTYFGANPEIEIATNFRIFQNNGIEIQKEVYLILEELRQLGSKALLQGEDELANEILQLVLAEKLRRKSV